MLKKILFLLFPVMLTAQYNMEMVAEKAYENSAIYFQSHFFNTEGIYRFKQVTPGLIDNPFLNTYINPAYIPKLDSGDALIFMDFRGDRTKPEIVENYVYPCYDLRSSYYPVYVPDKRTIDEARSEPEPVISIGFFLNPLKSFGHDAYLSGSFQVIHKNDKYYNMPFNIYRTNLLYDAFGNYKTGSESIPVVDRQAGRDEMSNDINLFTLGAGYSFDEKLSVGVGISGVFLTRDGGYLSRYASEYGTNTSSSHSSSNEDIRNHEYHHIDISAGVMYKVRQDFSFGLKAGWLKGRTEQHYTATSDYSYLSAPYVVGPDWRGSISNSRTEQNWTHDGYSNYYSLNLRKDVSANKSLNYYYAFRFTDEDISNNTSILDSSKYAYAWEYTPNNIWYKSNGTSNTIDNRAGSGKRKIYEHSMMLAYNWNISPATVLNMGLYYNRKKTTISTSEPVSANRVSQNFYQSGNSGSSTYYYALNETKTMQWDYSAENWTFQVPIWITHKFNDYFGCILGINRIVNSTNITDVTLAIYQRRYRNDNGSVSDEHNFGERYTEPVNKYTSTNTDIVGGITLDVSSAFKMKLLFDPESDPELRIAQWSLSLTLNI